MARLAGVEPAARGFEVRPEGLPAGSGASRSVTFRGLSASPTSPNVPTHPDKPGQFAALVLQALPGKLVSPHQAAELLGVNRETIYRLCSRGDLRCLRVGSILRVDLAGYLGRSQSLLALRRD
jgi:excisionase family DNA binding protein